MLKRLILLGIRTYQVALSPLLPARCRFYPTCSQYAKEAVESHGVGRGSLLALRRLLKCHPFHAGGVDLVPPSTRVESSLVEQKDGP